MPCAPLLRQRKAHQLSLYPSDTTGPFATIGRPFESGNCWFDNVQENLSHGTNGADRIMIGTPDPSQVASKPERQSLHFTERKT
jgi:hypothetical protein